MVEGELALRGASAAVEFRSNEGLVGRGDYS